MSESQTPWRDGQTQRYFAPGDSFAIFPPSQNVEQLTVLAEQVLGELRLGKQASSYKSAQKALRRLIELATTTTTATTPSE